MTTIAQALAAVMADVQGVGKKDRNNTPGASFNFRGIDAVTNAVGPALRKHGVIVVPSVEEIEYATVVVGKNRTEMSSVRLRVAFTWYGPEGDSIVSRTPGEAFDSGDKATAKAMSVAFRTAMIQTLCLPTDEPDPDSTSYSRSEQVVLSSDFDLLVQNAEEALDRAALVDLYEMAKASGNPLAVDAVATAGKKVAAALADKAKAEPVGASA